MPRQSLVLVLLSLVVSARVLNITVDDDTPATSRAAVSYDPAGAWFEGQNCLACHAKPDVNTAYNGTWHHTTDDGGIDTQDTVLTIQFTGTAIYVFCILANYVSASTGTMANYDFELDGNNAGNFHHDPENVTDYYYNIPVFSVADLDNDSHELVINVAGTRGIAGSSLMLFDYFTYTYDEDGTSSTASETPTPTSANAHPDDTPKSRTGVIVGSIIGGVAGLAIVVLALLFLLRRKRAHDTVVSLHESGRSARSAAGNPAVEPYPAPSHPPVIVASPEMAAVPSKTPRPAVDPRLAPSATASSSALSPRTDPPSSTSKAQAALNMRVRDMESRIAAIQNQHEPTLPSGEAAMRRQIDTLQAEIAMLHEQQREMMNNMSAPPPGYSDV